MNEPAPLIRFNDLADYLGVRAKALRMWWAKRGGVPLRRRMTPNGTITMADVTQEEAEQIILTYRITAHRKRSPL